MRRAPTIEMHSQQQLHSSSVFLAVLVVAMLALTMNAVGSHGGRAMDNNARQLRAKASSKWGVVVPLLPRISVPPSGPSKDHNAGDIQDIHRPQAPVAAGSPPPPLVHVPIPRVPAPPRSLAGNNNENHNNHH